MSLSTAFLFLIEKESGSELSTDNSSLLGWVLAGVGAVVSTLLAGVLKLFHMRENENSKAIAELRQEVAITKEAASKCEKDRVELFAACKVNEFEIATLKEKIASIDKDGTKYSHGLNKNKS